MRYGGLDVLARDGGVHRASERKKIRPRRSDTDVRFGAKVVLDGVMLMADAERHPHEHQCTPARTPVRRRA